MSFDTSEALCCEKHQHCHCEHRKTAVIVIASISPLGAGFITEEHFAAYQLLNRYPNRYPYPYPYRYRNRKRKQTR